MRRQLAARLLQSLIVVFVVTTISFFVIHLAPGDPFLHEGRNLTESTQQARRHEAGYDRPLAEQYLSYVGGVARGDLGYSESRREPVIRALAATIPRTLLLTGLSLALSLGIGIVIGVLQATHRDGWFDRASSIVLVFFYSLPDFWGALMILLVFGYWLRLFPTAGIVEVASHDYMTAWQAFSDRLRHLVLPLGSFTILTLAGITRYQRAAMLETLPLDYIRTARAKGLSERQIVWRHALRTSLSPMITLLGLMLPALLGGAVFIETVFNWPGMGLLASSAITSRDYQLVTATVIAGSTLVVVGNLLADLLQMAVDPRVRE